MTGVEGRIKDNVLGMLSIYLERKDPDLAVGRLYYLHKKAIPQIKKALEPFGYFKPQIKGSLRCLDKEKGRWVATYQINKGPRIRIGRVEFKILGPGAREPFLDMTPPLVPGKRFKQGPYEQFKSQLLANAVVHGYLDAHFVTHQVAIDLKDYKANIKLIMDTGPRYYFGQVKFEGSHLSEDFLRRFINFKPGQPFESKKLIQLKKRLLDSGYFRSAQIRPKKDEAGPKRRIPIRIILAMKKPNVYRAGLGYASGIGPRVVLEWHKRYIGHSGHHFKTKMVYSPDNSLISAEYIIPLTRPYSDYLSIAPGIERYDTDNRNGYHYSTDIFYSVVTPSGWRRDLGINLGYERYKVAGESSGKPALNPFMSWYKSVSDNLLYTRNGYMVRFNLGAGLGSFSPDKSYINTLLNTKFIRSLGQRYRLITRCDLGSVLIKDFKELPASVRFFAGGQNSIRGFDLDELGPRDPDSGDIVGGRFLAVASLELERQLYKKWSGAVFCDIGNSFDPKYKNKVAVGTGFGIRWNTPVGPIRLDFGFGVSQNPVPFKFYLSMGPEL